MTVSNCPEHSDLVRDLARGTLDEEQWSSAEAALEKCAHCVRWWSGTFAGAGYEAVDRAVADVIARFEPPARRRHRWLAAAAAAVLAIGVGTTTMLWRGAAPSPNDAGDVVSTLDFEAGTLNGAVATSEDADASGESAVFSTDLESGDLSSWSSHS